MYFGVDIKELKRQWICKSEITRQNLDEMNIPSSITIKEAKEIFDSIKEDKYIRIVSVGNSINKNQRKHVKYVLKCALYKKIIDW